MQQPFGPLWVSSRSSNTPVATAQGWNIRFRPTSPLRLARPSGNRGDLEFSRMRGVPTPLQAMITTSARCRHSLPSAS